MIETAADHLGADDRTIEVRTRATDQWVTLEIDVTAACAAALPMQELSRGLQVVGGRVLVRPHGARAVVCLELLTEPARPLAAAVETGAIAAPDKPPRLKILLIDDDEFVLASVSRVLAVHALDTESDAERGVERAIGGEYDIVLCDVMMPNLSGIDVFRRVAATRPDVAARFIFLSGGGVDEGVMEFLEHEAPARLDKPFGADALRRTIARVSAGG